MVLKTVVSHIVARNIQQQDKNQILDTIPLTSAILKTKVSKANEAIVVDSNIKITTNHFESFFSFNFTWVSNIKSKIFRYIIIVPKKKKKIHTPVFYDASSKD